MKLLDGTGRLVPDTAENQARFPQPSRQAGGVGFPQLRLCTVLDLVSGALLAAASGPHQCAGNIELDRSRTLLSGFSRDALLLADPLYAHHFLVAQLIEAGVDVPLKQYGSRNTDIRRGARDHVVHWSKPDHRPRGMSPEQHAAALAQLRLGVVKVGGRILVTMLRVPEQFIKPSFTR